MRDRNKPVSFGRIARLGVVVALLAWPAACAYAPPPTQDAALKLQSLHSAGSTAAEIDSPLGAYLAGRVARHERDTAAAARYFSRALASDPDNLDLLRQTYFAMHAEGRMAEASELANRIVDVGLQEPMARLTYAVELIKAGDFASAQAQIQALPRQGYNTLLVPLLSAWTAGGRGQFDEAIRALDAFEGNEAFAVFRAFHSALINDIAGDVEAAAREYRDVVDSQPGGSFRAVTAFGSFYERTGKPETAIELYRSYQEENPDSIWFEPVLARQAAGRLPERMVRSASDGAAEALFGLASILYQESALEAALLYARLAIRLRPNFDAGALLLGEILEAQTRAKEAVTAYQSIVATSPLLWSARLRIAANLDDLDRTNEAVAELRKMGNERPERSDALIALGDLLRARENWSEAVVAYDEGIARIGQFERRHWRPLYARGIALERSKQWPRAESDFLRALDLAPDQPFVLNYLGYSWVDQGENLDRAFKMIERAVDLRPNDGYIVDSLGWAQYRMENFADAVIQLERAVELRPDDPTINDHLGDALWRVGRRIEARFQWRRALSLTPESDEQIAIIQSKLKKGLLPADIADGGS